MALILAVALAGVPSALQAQTVAEAHSFDAIGRLTGVSYPNGSSIQYSYDANGNLLSIVISLGTTAVEGGQGALQFTLGPTTPNPGSGARNVSFTIPSRGHVALRVFDVLGREVAILIDRELPAGRHDVRFFTDRWAAGVYYYRLESAGRTLSGRFVVLR